MSELLKLLTEAVASKGRERDAAALLLSGGIDSLSVGLALQKAGRRVHAYTFYLDRSPSKDLKRAIRVAAHYGWRHTGIAIPTASMADDFIRLAVEYGCLRKVHFEVMYPMLYVFPMIVEHEVYTGWNADFYYGNGKEDQMRRRRLVAEGVSRSARKTIFDNERRLVLKNKLLTPSDETWWYAQRIAGRYSKTVLAPYLQDGVRDFFLQFDQEELSSPKKPVVRQALTLELSGLCESAFGDRAPLQIEGGISAIFETLLKNDTINRFEPQYSTISQLCQRWAREVKLKPTSYHAELEPLPKPPAATNVMYAKPACTPYRMADVYRDANLRQGRALSMFAGGGGSCIGLQLAGFNVVLANEFVPEAARTYAVNFPSTVVDTRDIRKIAESRSAVEAFVAQVGIAPGEPDLVSGSPPCSEFSSAGRGIADPRIARSYSDTSQSGIAGLLFDFMRFNRAALPKVIISENVPPLATTYRPLLEAALDHLRFTSEGGQRLYFVGYRVLSSDDYGVPQARRRLFVIAVRSDVARAVGLDNDGDLNQLFPPPICAPITIRDAFKGLSQTADQMRPWRQAMRTSALAKVVRKLPMNPRSTVRPSHIGLGSQSRFSLARPPWDTPVPTLTVMGQRPDGLCGIVHPAEDRKFTIPELMRLTGLPDDYRLTGTIAQAAERICRMVPPLMVKAVADRVRDLVLTPYREASNG